MRTAILALLAAVALAACANPVVQQAAVETRHDPVRADEMLAVAFAPGSGRIDAGQANELRGMVAAAQRAEFVVVTDGSGGPIQRARAHEVSQSLSSAGARWVSTAVEPAMPMGPDRVVVVRSAYRIAERGCPNYTPASFANPNEAAMPGFGCADAYNMGQMLARPRDAAVARPMGPADGTVNAAAIQRYREGRVRTASSGGGGTSTAGMSGVGEPAGGGLGAALGGLLGGAASSTSGTSGASPPPY
jgi:pilus biogenesis lipoprotein CpaD